MTNIFEQPWLLFIISGIALAVIYFIYVDRRMYYLAMLSSSCVVAYSILFESQWIPLSATLSLALKIAIPIAAIALLAILVKEIKNSKDKLAFYWLLPMLLALLAVSCDSAVKTDNEKIRVTLSNIFDAVQNENIDMIDKTLADTYTDQIHKTKKQLLDRCRAFMYEPLITNVFIINKQLQINKTDAVLDVSALISLEQGSWAQTAAMADTVTVTLKITMIKTSKKQWRINRADIIKVNGQALNWSQINSYL